MISSKQISNPFYNRPVNIKREILKFVGPDPLFCCSNCIQELFLHPDNPVNEQILVNIITKAKAEAEAKRSCDVALYKLFPGLFPANTEGTLPREQIIEALQRQKQSDLSAAMLRIMDPNHTIIDPESIAKHVDLVQILIDSDLDITTYGDSLLTKAMGYGHIEIMKLLLEHGANPDGKSGSEAPLLVAASAFSFDEAIKCKFIEMAKLLLEHGANPNVQGNWGETALFWAIESDQMEMAKLLLEYGADPNMQNHDGKTALFVAAASDRVEFVELLLEAKANFRIEDDNERTAFLEAIQHDSFKAATALLRAEAQLMSIEILRTLQKNYRTPPGF